jgi:GLPGLI family protein
MKNILKQHIRLVLFIGLTLSTSISFSQSAIPLEGTIRYLRTQNWAKMMSNVDYISKTQRDRLMYVWGSRSEWKTYSLLHFNQTMSKYEDSEERAEPDAEGWSNRKETFFLKRDYTKNTMYDGIEQLGKTYLIHDTITPIPWKILNDMREVAGHICMNAFWNDTLRQQKVTAWFALDMPVSAGPERFTGLPGMILEVDINDGAMVVTADKIDLKPLVKELDVPEKIKGKKINEAEYITLLTKYMKEQKTMERPWFWGIRY